ncbi:hypothetical protein NEF87_001228 [Candidatus Lokiarchaeum ossiferum]|uniref:Serine/threonine specific protein phosphatases domain-containing protein n=1 Tax=Candidatus Lokiarchaeum ossiferum TaxID=2951803 RepID=A0ABY6HNQ9_9ARCH|nr:hypothetical protein NEF87_001228 [Candidatus Lokiarchaeum sp. B-35]
MAKQIHICHHCKHAFYYSEKEAASKLCRNCLKEGLVVADRMIVVCPTCLRQYDSHLIEKRSDKPLDNAPDLQLGMLICPKDQTPLETHGIKEDIGRITDEIFEKFAKYKLIQQQEEAEYIKKLTALRQEISSDISTHPITDAQESLETVEPIVSPLLPIISGFKEIHISDEKIPFANKFWDFYQNSDLQVDSDVYVGDEKAPEMIRGLLEEFSDLYLGNEFLDLSIPLVESINQGKVYYVGDTHGSIIDTHKCIQFFLTQIQKAQETNEEILIVFDGDYVDRSPYDIHNILYIFSFALKFPQYVRVLRGNHEDVTISMNYGFWENINKYLPNSYLFNDFGYVFMKLPLVHVVRHDAKQIMCVHGGIPFYDREFEELPIIPNITAGLDRLDSKYSNMDEMDILSQQILWSDPAAELPPGMYFLPSPRGAGFTFGEEIFNRFCEINKVDRVVRGHEVYLDGHREYFQDRLFSIFSCSQYGTQEITAKILEIDFSKPWTSNWQLLTILTDLN